jgi:hypothetical protein
MRARQGIVVLIAVMGVVAGCGSGPSSPAPAATTPLQAAASTSPAPPTPRITPRPTPSPTVRPASTPRPTPTPTPTAPRTGRIVLEDEQLALTLPKGWREVPLSADDIESFISIYPKGTFSAAQLAAIRQFARSGMRFVGYQVKGKGVGSNVNIGVVDMEVPLALVRATLPGQLEQFDFVRNAEISETTFGGVDAVRVTYDLRLDVRGTIVKGRGVQVQAVANGRTYGITITLIEGSRLKASAILKTLDFDP